MPSWVIVGASRGIGYQYLRTLSQDSSNTVIGIVRNLSAAETKLESDGLRRTHLIHGDLDDAASLTAAAEQVSHLTGGVVDHLILNGAYMSSSTALLAAPDFFGKEALFVDEVNKSLLTNVAGTLFAINSFMPQIKKSAIKKVVAITSGAADAESMGKAEMAEGIPYAISKAALNMLVAKFAVSYRAESIIFLALSPGFVYTFTESLETAPTQFKGLLDYFVGKMRKLAPEFKGPMLPEQSVEMQIKVIEGLGIEQSGQALGHHGDKRWV